MLAGHAAAQRHGRFARACAVEKLCARRRRAAAAGTRCRASRELCAADARPLKCGQHSLRHVYCPEVPRSLVCPHFSGTEAVRASPSCTVLPRLVDGDKRALRRPCALAKMRTTLTPAHVLPRSSPLARICTSPAAARCANSSAARRACDTAHCTAKSVLALRVWMEQHNDKLPADLQDDFWGVPEWYATGMADMRLRCNDGENCAGEAGGGPRPPPRRLAAPASAMPRRAPSVWTCTQTRSRPGCRARVTMRKTVTVTATPEGQLRRWPAHSHTEVDHIKDPLGTKLSTDGLSLAMRSLCTSLHLPTPTE